MHLGWLHTFKRLLYYALPPSSRDQLIWIQSLKPLGHVLADLDVHKAGWAHNQHCALTGYCQPRLRNAELRSGESKNPVREEACYRKCIQLREQREYSLECV